MDRASPRRSSGRSSFPRACGDGPTLLDDLAKKVGFSPRMRGWTGQQRPPALAALVFPAHAGMDRARRGSPGRSRGFPRACGDGPSRARFTRGAMAFSPRMRGWTAGSGGGEMNGNVFPAHAGMDRCRSGCLGVRYCFPRACGDGPIDFYGLADGLVVFPAHAGMDRPRPAQASSRTGFPRACGDGPTSRWRSTRVTSFSPRMRGWTEEAALSNAIHQVFPAHAGMDRARSAPGRPS